MVLSSTPGVIPAVWNLQWRFHSFTDRDQYIFVLVWLRISECGLKLVFRSPSRKLGERN